jgi:photosystem II stability/assembly factor-like uncharacterized protein
MENNPKSQTLVLVLLLVTIFAIIVTTIAALTARELEMREIDEMALNANYAAETGWERGMYYLKYNSPITQITINPECTHPQEIPEYGANWTETYPTEKDEHIPWYAVASDADGSNLIVASRVTAYGGRLYTSSNGGVKWFERQPLDEDLDKNWQSVASDSDGKNLIAVVYGGELYISHDYGVTWAKKRPTGIFFPNKNYWAVASDSDGSNLIAAVYGGELYISSDYGDSGSWKSTYPTGSIFPNKNYRSVASDDDGSNLIAGVAGGKVFTSYTSSDGVLHWQPKQPGGAIGDWNDVASDADGSNLMAADYGGGRIYTSSDSGTSWTETYPDGANNKPWSAVASDADGSNLMAGAFLDSDKLYTSYTSSDGVLHWAERQPGGTTFKGWFDVASDDNGSNLIAADENNGRLYISSAPDVGTCPQDCPDSKCMCDCDKDPMDNKYSYYVVITPKGETCEYRYCIDTRGSNP